MFDEQNAPHALTLAERLAGMWCFHFILLLWGKHVVLPPAFLVTSTTMNKQQEKLPSVKRHEPNNDELKLD